MRGPTTRAAPGKAAEHGCGRTRAVPSWYLADWGVVQLGMGGVRWGAKDRFVRLGPADRRDNRHRKTLEQSAIDTSADGSITARSWSRGRVNASDGVYWQVQRHWRRGLGGIMRLHSAGARAKKRAMLVARTRADLATAVESLHLSHGGIALVPTMGALHAGHLALLHQARQAGHAIAASIFVNPTQFGPGEDFERYPRQEEDDLSHLRAAGCDLVWLPRVADMYAAGDATMIEVGGPALGWEGAIRPGHFRGVATVVAKLFGQVRPRAAVFGEKDWQQLQVIRRMTADLALPVQVIGAPVVREPDGLAMSSRNRFLSVTERARAPGLFAALCAMRDAMAAGSAAADAAHMARRTLGGASFEVEYLALVDGPTLVEIPRASEGGRIIAAARMGSVRLLDNIALG
jgi:pantoate--beta-alanine ligase